MSQLLCSGEHQNCFRYEDPKSSSIEIIHYPKGQKWQKTLNLGEIVIVCGGSILLSYDH